MGFGEGLRNLLTPKRTVENVQLITERGNGFYEWGGTLYESDVVRAAIRPFVKAVGKLVAKHIRETTNADGSKRLTVNPEPYLRFLLEEPNSMMSMQVLLEKMAAQLKLNNNAFALIARDENGYPTALYPLIGTAVEAVYSGSGDLLLRFTLLNGKMMLFRYADIIHIRDDFHENDIFGTPKTATIMPLLNVISTIDQGVVRAIRNGAVIRWLLKFTQSTRPEDIAAKTKEFADAFLHVENATGVAGVDTKADAIQVTPHDYVPNAVQTSNTHTRLLQAFNTNAAIVDSSRDEDEWNAYFDAEVEPVLLQLQSEFTRKLFSRKERGYGNRIAFEASNWDSASVKTKLALADMVDRGALTPNEWRATFNLAPVPGGDDPIRRLDTAPAVSTSAGGGDGE